ncbi:MAG: hypothetical protein WCW26_05450 [Candidatus Buchananbacteria bacterium]
MINNIAINAIRYVFVDFVADLLYWPIWWYSKGLVNTAKFCLNKAKDWQEKLALLVWIKNIFRPMFGQYDWESRLISFVIRVIQIIFRLILFLVAIIFLVLVFLFYFILPIVIGLEIYNNFWSLFY